LDSSQLSEAISRINKSILSENDSRKIVDCMNDIKSHEKKEFKRKIEFKFLSSPKEIKGNGKVEEVIFAINEIKDGKVVETETTYSIDAGLVITAIGYESVEIPGINIENGRIGNIAGHVKNNLYVTGWAKRGPVGLIGTNKSDSTDLVNLITKNLRVPKNLIGIEGLLKTNHRVVDQTGWEKINAQEVISGNLLGKPRLKESNWERLINLGTS
jgi:ferredoxin--NADP+ reductase